jgi:hypothetical protein
LDEAEFLSDKLSVFVKSHKQTYEFGYKGNNYSIQYEPGSTSNMFGGNSNWRVLSGFLKLPHHKCPADIYEYYGDKFSFEFPVGSGTKLNLKQIANELTKGF